MIYQYDNTAVNATLHADGTMSFEKGGEFFRTETDAWIDNFQGGAAYQAYLVDADGDQVGLVVWEIANPDCDDQSDACDWDKFDVYA